MVNLPDIEAEGERIAAETWKHPSGMYLWTDMLGAIQTAIADERARHASGAAEAQINRLIAAVVEEAEQACRYLGEHNSDGEQSEYRDGFQSACEILGTSTTIADHVTLHRDRIIAALATPATSA